LHKSDRLEAEDPSTKKVVPFYNPRTQAWADHFQWLDCSIVGISPARRATIAALNLNHPRRVRIRQAGERFGFFPPAYPLLETGNDNP
jgi:hypothetical protein